MRSSAARRAAEQDGQLLPLFGAVMVLVLVLGIAFTQVGGAARLATRGQTAADAAALAGAQDVKRQAEALAVASGGGFTPAMIDPVTVCAAAAAYAARNDGTLTACRLEQFDVLTTVRTRTLDRPGEDDDVGVDRERARATSRARARVEGIYSLNAPGFGAGGGGAGGATPTGGSGVSDAELHDLEDEAGVKALPNTSLQTYGSKVTGLTKYMKVAILKAEHLLDAPLQINSGYRSYADQVQACQGAVNGICATPGTSLHEKGLAIDVQNYADLLRVAARAGLCRPIPADYVHFSPIGGPECGGQASTGSPGGPGAFGGPGGLGAFVTFRVLLVRYDAPPE